MTTTASEGKAVEAIALDAAPETPRRQGRTGASSVTLPSGTSLAAFTQRVRQAGAVAGKTGARAAALADRPGSLVHSQPPTFHQSHARHHEAARHYEALLLRCPRLLWGYFHLLAIKPALNFLEWVTESPARLAVALAIAAIVWIWR